MYTQRLRGTRAPYSSMQSFKESSQSSNMEMRRSKVSNMDIKSLFNILVSVIAILVASDFIQPSSGQYITLGLCPRIGGMPKFNISRYEGLWYEVEKYWFAFEATASCTSVRYVASGDGTFGVEINMLEEITRTKMSMPGVTWYRSRDGSADFMLDLLITQSPIPFHFKYPYLVLDTDYDNYTIKYLCKQLGPFSVQTMWVLSRRKDLSPESREQIYNFLRRVGINVQKLRRSNTSTCSDIGN